MTPSAVTGIVIFPKGPAISTEWLSIKAEFGIFVVDGVSPDVWGWKEATAALPDVSLFHTLPLTALLLQDSLHSPFTPFLFGLLRAVEVFTVFSLMTLFNNNNNNNTGAVLVVVETIERNSKWHH